MKIQNRKMQDQKDERTENAGLQMQDQISGGDQSGTKVGLKVVDHKMQDQGDRLSDALPDLLMEQGFPYFLK